MLKIVCGVTCCSVLLECGNMLSFSQTGVQKVVSDHALYIALNSQSKKNAANHFIIVSHHTTTVTFSNYIPWINIYLP